MLMEAQTQILETMRIVPLDSGDQLLEGSFMATWLYQLTQKEWSPERYRFDIWENERWKWHLRHDDGENMRILGDERPEPGDVVIFFFAAQDCDEPGFYGWAVVLNAWNEEARELYFRPVAPSDQLKMHPWGNEDGMKLSNEIRNPSQGTLRKLSLSDAKRIRSGILAWIAVMK
jgi:hypothetical protein